MKIINEQLIFDLKGDSIKIPFLYVKKSYLNDLYYNVRIKSDPQKKKLIDKFFKKNFPGIIPKQLPNSNKKLILWKKDVVSSSEFKLKYDCNYVLRFSEFRDKNTNGSFRKPNTIIMNKYRFFNVMERFNAALDVKGWIGEVLLKNCLTLLKEIFITMKHELIHLIDFQDNLKKHLYGKKTTADSGYYLKEVEYPTFLSNTYSQIKHYTSSGRNKMSYKEFSNFLHGRKIMFNHKLVHSPFLFALYRYDSERHKDACIRLFNLLKQHYLYDDGFKFDF